MMRGRWGPELGQPGCRFQAAKLPGSRLQAPGSQAARLPGSCGWRMHPGSGHSPQAAFSSGWRCCHCRRQHSAHHHWQDNHIPQVCLHLGLCLEQHLLLGLEQVLQGGVGLPPSGAVQSLLMLSGCWRRATCSSIDVGGTGVNEEIIRGEESSKYRDFSLAKLSLSRGSLSFQQLR